jgi:hypothetical protein
MGHPRRECVPPIQAAGRRAMGIGFVPVVERDLHARLRGGVGVDGVTDEAVQGVCACSVSPLGHQLMHTRGGGRSYSPRYSPGVMPDGPRSA